MRKIAWMLCLMLLMGVTWAHADTYLTWNELNGETYGATVAARAFVEEITALSSGKMHIDLYTDGMLGSEAQSMQGLQMGTLDIFRGNASSLPNFGAELIGVTGLPYVFTDMEQFHDVAGSSLGQELLDSVEAADCGYLALAWLVEGPRSLFITEKTWQAIGSPDSFTLDMIRDLNIRVPDTTLMRATMDALGAHATPIVYDALLNSLRAGSVDGAENGVTSYMSAGFYEAAPYFITDAHTFGCGVILVSRSTWDALSEEEQGWLRTAAAKAADVCYAYNLKQETACFDQFASLGIRRLEVTDIEAWQAACRELYDQQTEEAQAIIRRIQSGEY